ncbi:hypothetical protein EV192_12332 [Actinocrispum wychmicini]|uniref:Uncharacterized protein n=1 Tax=Actinocrispum wychmicini TaxID=1213861 RepID=A0A4R2IIA6_9PSEU|nr:hypothetical protein EV192_12332 [Actinocrispum wychmicini]
MCPYTKRILAPQGVCQIARALLARVLVAGTVRANRAGHLAGPRHQLGRSQQCPDLPDRRAPGSVRADRARRRAVSHQVQPGFGDHPGAVHHDPAAGRPQPQGCEVVDGRPEPGGPQDHVRVQARPVRPPHAGRGDLGEDRPPGHRRQDRPQLGRHPQAGHADHALRRQPGADALVHHRDRAAADVLVEHAVADHRPGPGDPGDSRGDLGDLSDLFDPGRAAANYDHALPAELVGAAVVRGMQLASLERGHSRVVRPERVRPRAGRADDRARSPLARIRGHDEAVAGTSADGPDPNRSLHGDGELTFVGGVVLRHHLGGRSAGVGIDRREAGQRVDAVYFSQTQGVPAVAPRSTGSVVAVEHHVRREAVAGQVVRARQAGLAGADDHHVCFGHAEQNARESVPLPDVSEVTRCLASGREHHPRGFSPRVGIT